jgi:hypothetical protein
VTVKSVSTAGIFAIAPTRLDEEVKKPLRFATMSLALLPLMVSIGLFFYQLQAIFDAPRARAKRSGRTMRK